MTSSHRTYAGGRSLDFLNLFVANIQTGFGPFVAVYLTTQGWTQTTIGVALSVGTVAAMASQIPAGIVVDVSPRKSVIAGLSLLAFSVCALLFAIRPTLLGVFIAETLHGFASCTLGPCIAAMSIAFVGHSALAARFGRNARYASIGNAVGAALMGGFGYYLSTRSVFFLAAALSFPAIALVWPLRKLDPRARPHPNIRYSATMGTAFRVLGDSRLLIFAACQLLFTLGNAAMLPLASVTITEQMPANANLLIAAFIVLPQLVVAVTAHRVGRYAQTIGRRMVMIAALAALTMRGLLFAIAPDPILLISNPGARRHIGSVQRHPGAPRDRRRHRPYQPLQFRPGHGRLRRRHRRDHQHHAGRHCRRPDRRAVCNPLSQRRRPGGNAVRGPVSAGDAIRHNGCESFADCGPSLGVDADLKESAPTMKLARSLGKKNARATG